MLFFLFGQKLSRKQDCICCRLPIPICPDLVSPLLIHGTSFVKLPAHRAGLPGNEISFLFVPLDPAYKTGLAGHLPAN